MTTENNAVRPLSLQECDDVGGALHGSGWATTMAIGEEDGGWRGPIMTTMALGEEEPRELNRHKLPLDAAFHIGV
ncbi:MAG: hypothetical protein Q4G22_13160 [Paracoccus sp. (in: a-proteobacteria)]|uniref:hypothetical protein n=1 Tax=Paracoccus sp. TaxID=267 RepID=UPI0026E05311|nr:hypothetical protein [Paracoccus sp. (in: a-proteobacteria)]MDO5632767.1 hypothetical protein [Paracoccus sp. (in: a-proteobacteria)]